MYCSPAVPWAPSSCPSCCSISGSCWSAPGWPDGWAPVRKHEKFRPAPRPTEPILDWRVIQEARAGAGEGQAYRADGAVTLLADDDLRRALVGRIGVVDLVAIDEQDQVGVLLDGARFT